MRREEKEERLLPLTVYLVPEEATCIRSLAEDAGVSVSLYLRQKLKRLLPIDVCNNNTSQIDIRVPNGIKRIMNGNGS